MRVGILCLYGNKIGGTEIAAENLRLALSDIFDVEVVTAFEYTRDMSVTITKRLDWFIKLRRCLSQYDILVTTDLATFCMLSIARFFSVTKSKIIMWEHYPYEKNSVIWRAFNKVFCFSKHAEKLVVLSDLECQKWQGHANLTKISNSVKIPQQISMNHRTGLVYIGRVTVDKGVRRLLAAFEYLNDINMTLTIIGDGELLPELKKKYLHNGNIIFLGSLPNAAYLLERFNIFVSGSYYECFPISILEAMAAGLPIVSFDNSGGTSSVLMQSNGGFIVNSYADFKCKIKFLNESNNAEFYGKNGRSFVMHNFSFDEYQKQWIKIINEI